MEKEVNTSSNNNNNNSNNIIINNNQDQNPSSKLEQSPRKAAIGGVGGGGGVGDRLKRDEWSEGAVSSLLEAYESKWILRNRAKLKGQDWEDVAKHVSSRANCSKSLKTQTQCKNKIESMKKRYRSESATATADTSSWPLFSRLDHLLRGTGASAGPPTPPSKPSAVATATVVVTSNNPSNLALLESTPVAQPLPPPPPLPPPQPAVEIAQNSQESDGVDPIIAKEDGGIAAKSSDNIVSDKKQDDIDHNDIETDSSTPALYSNDRKPNNKMKMKTNSRKRRRRSDDSSSNWEDIAESIRWLAEAVVRSEQARMETMRELERMRVEADAKRGEMDLKRTEIIANTQLEIAKIFASAASASASGKAVDSSLRIGRNL